MSCSMLKQHLNDSIQTFRFVSFFHESQGKLCYEIEKNLLAPVNWKWLLDNNKSIKCSTCYTFALEIVQNCENFLSRDTCKMRGVYHLEVSCINITSSFSLQHIAGIRFNFTTFIGTTID